MCMPFFCSLWPVLSAALPRVYGLRYLPAGGETHIPAASFE